MSEQSGEGPVIIESPLDWNDVKLNKEIDDVASKISKIKDYGGTQEAARCTTLSAKLNIYSGELARRASERASEAADRLAKSNRDLSILALVISVVSMIFGGLSYCRPPHEPIASGAHNPQVAP